jgi:uncharacterized protein YhfF
VEHGQLEPAEFAFPGPLRDQLVAAILAGEKTSTSSLVEEYEREGEALPRVGVRTAVVDSAGRPVAVIETTEVQIVRMADVDDGFARDEGEGFADAGQWRAAHERFWTSEEFVAAVGAPAIVLDDDTPVVCERFRLVERIA